MKSSKKITIIVALCFMLAGVLVCAGGFAAANFNFERFDYSVYTTNDYTFTEKLSNINIDCDTAKIDILESKNNSCKLTCYEDEKFPHKVILEDGTLTITEAKKHWYDYIKMFNFRTPQITLYLPHEMYNSITLRTDTGHINTEHISATKMELKTSTGPINLQNTEHAEYIDLKATTGKVEVRNTNCTNLKAETSTGSITLQNVKTQKVETKATTGDTNFQNILSDNNISAKASTGDIIFENSDGRNIYAKTTTGHIKGTILTSKTFNANTTTGKVSVPNSNGSGIFEASATTGNIIINYSTTE